MNPIEETLIKEEPVKPEETTKLAGSGVIVGGEITEAESHVVEPEEADIDSQVV